MRLPQSQIRASWDRKGDARAVILILLAAICFCTMNYFVRLSKDVFRADTLVFFRSLMQALFLLPWIKDFIRPDPVGGRKRKLQFHFARGASGIGSMFFLYLSLHYLPLAAATLLALSSVLWAALFARLGLKEKLSRLQGLFVLLALFGMGIAVISSNGSGNWQLDPRGIAAALTCGFFMGLALTSLKKLRSHVGSREIVFYFGVVGVLLMIPSMSLSPQLPANLTEVSWVCAVGIAATLGQLLMTAGFKYTSTVVASLSNLQQTPLNLLVGFWLLGETPPSTFFVGVLLTLMGMGGLLYLRGKLSTS